MTEKVEGFITFLYYKDLKKAMHFYEEVMGLQLIVDQGWSKIYRVTGDAYVGLVDEGRGYHRSSTTKPVIICLVVPDVDSWHRHLKEKGVDNLSDPADSKELKIRSFILTDPEGYVIEIQTRPY